MIHKVLLLTEALILRENIDPAINLQKSSSLVVLC